MTQSPSYADKKRAEISQKTSESPHCFCGPLGGNLFHTICCQRRAINQLCRREIAEGIFKTASNYDRDGVWYLRLMLLMPDHLHALIGISGDASLSTLVANFKRATRRFVEVEWQRNFFDHRLRPNEGPIGKETYIRENPVRARLVEHASAWRWVLDRSDLEMAVR